MDGGLDAGADARGSAMDAPIGARASAKGAGALSAVRGRIAQVKLRITAVSSVLIAAAMCGLPARAQEMRPTAQEVVAAIQEHVGVPWKAETVDTFKAGNPESGVTGIAVTMMATLDVLQRAGAKGENLVITHERTFYNHLDRPEEMDEGDAVWKEKRAFIEKNGLVIWRFHDHWHLRKPDGILAGMVQALGWEKYQNAENPHLFTMPETTLEKLAADVAKRLETPVLRVVGNPKMRVTKVALSPGSAGLQQVATAQEMGAGEVRLCGRAARAGHLVE